MPRSLSLREWSLKIDALERAKHQRNWKEWQRIANEGVLQSSCKGPKDPLQSIKENTKYGK